MNRLRLRNEIIAIQRARAVAGAVLWTAAAGLVIAVIYLCAP